MKERRPLRSLVAVLNDGFSSARYSTEQSSVSARILSLLAQLLI
jgi:hypothetical protein